VKQDEAVTLIDKCKEVMKLKLESRVHHTNANTSDFVECKIVRHTLKVKIQNIMQRPGS